MCALRHNLLGHDQKIDAHMASLHCKLWELQYIWQPLGSGYKEPTFI